MRVTDNRMRRCEMSSSMLCPTCNQDMRDDPRPSWRGKNCPQCGQGLPVLMGRKPRKMIKG